MKYMIMVFGDQSGLEGKSREWIMEMHEFMKALNEDLRKSGELIYAEGLADPSQAKTVRIRDGVPVATDGPFVDPKKSLAGYWAVDVDDEARAIEIASGVVAFTEEPIEIRQYMDEPPEM